MRSTQELKLSQRKNAPSFSSSLLDAIYSSIDEEIFNASTTNNDFPIGHETKTKTHETVTCKKYEIQMCRRHQLEAIMIEKPRVFKTDKQFLNSASSSSSSRNQGSTLFSPSSTHRAISLPSCFAPIRSKQIRTGNSTRSDDQQSKQQQQNLNPISPSRRISIILNSLFNAKKKCNVVDKTSSKSTTTTAATTSTTCSLTSSFTWSVFTSKAQSLTPRSHTEQSKQYKKHDGNIRSVMINSDQFDDGGDDDYDDDDVGSNASSDLFEIENLIGIRGKYVEELPVYGTTDLNTNLKTKQAIARGLFV